MTPPIRFLASALGGWACLRGAMLVPWQAEDPSRGQPAARGAAPRLEPAALDDVHEPSVARVRAVLRRASRPSAATARRLGIDRRIPSPVAGSAASLPHRPLSPSPAFLSEVRSSDVPAAENPSTLQAVRRPTLSGWTASAWLHGRGGDAPSLAPGGSLGGSQAGARLGFRMSSALQLTARLSTPLQRPAGAEAAIGAEWQPIADVPLRLLGERRQKLGREGRSAWAVTVHGGAGDLPLPAGLRLEIYGQAGIVGARSRDLFIEASARAARPVGRGLSLGAGIWGAAQPGAARLDLGPSAVLRLPHLGASLSADWRFRAAGLARPGSGPALTLQTDF